jgi:DNA-binding NarL/FixJ family response regulator
MEVIGEAVDGSDALNLMRSTDWDVAILDYSMPGRDGVELVREIRRQHPSRPILILSVFPEEAHATQALKAGAAGYLNKESACDELTSAIRRVANGGKYVSPALAEKLAMDLSTDASKPLHEYLSDREYRVMWLLASGKQINQIAEDMCLSPSTISTYRSRILKKLKLDSNAAIVRYAIKFQLAG